MVAWKPLREYFEMVSRRDDPEWKQLGAMHMWLIDHIQTDARLKDLNCTAVGLNIDIEGANAVVRLYWKYDTGFLLSRSSFDADDTILVSQDQILDVLPKLIS